jgi:hypothetical protein
MGGGLGRLCTLGSRADGRWEEDSTPISPHE